MNIKFPEGNQDTWKYVGVRKIVCKNIILTSVRKLVVLYEYQTVNRSQILRNIANKILDLNESNYINVLSIFVTTFLQPVYKFCNWRRARPLK